MLKTGLINVFSKLPKKCDKIQTVTVNYRLFSNLKLRKCLRSSYKSEDNHNLSRVFCRYTHNDYQRSTLPEEDEETGDYERSEEWTKAEDNQDEVIGAFKNFSLSQPTIHKLHEQGIKYLFPVQTNTYEHIYEGSDVIVQARTGSGKTMSYALPLVEKLLQSSDSHNQSRLSKLLVLTPTRELANQVAQVISSLANNIKVVPVFGGAPVYNQENMLRRGADVVVGTPGRLLDLISRKSLDLTQLNHVVLDEVDRMLDMGFADDVDRILKMRYNQSKREDNPQTLLFSATIPSWVQRTGKKYLSRGLKMLDLVGTGTNKTAMSVKHTAMLCTREQRESAIIDLMINIKNADDDEGTGIHRTIVFCQTKREVDDLGGRLRGKVAVLHGDVSQYSRDLALKRFKSGEVACLVATDVAARGLDIPDVDQVIQCSPPPDVEAYIHRSGRTGRAGKTGHSIVLYTPDEAEDVRRVQVFAKCLFEKSEYIKSPVSTKTDLIKSLRRVNGRVIEEYDGLKKELVDEFGEDRLMGAAIAILAGHVQKSLINSRVGLTTLHLHQSNSSPLKITNPSKVIDLLKSCLSDELTSLVRNMRLRTDLQGAVFDIPSNKEDAFMKAWAAQPTPLTISIPTTLPPIHQAPQSSFSNNRDSSYRGGYDGSRRSNDGYDRSRRSNDGYDRSRRSNDGYDRSGGDRRNSYDTFGRENRGGGSKYGGRSNGRDGGYQEFTHARSGYKSLQD